MLVISRKSGESIVIQDAQGRQLVIRVMLKRNRRNMIAVAFAEEGDSKSFEIWREEIAESKLSATDNEHEVKKESSKKARSEAWWKGLDYSVADEE